MGILNFIVGKGYLGRIAYKLLPKMLCDRMYMPKGYKNAKIFSDQLYPKTYPTKYHFLMNNYCNASCVFCNQVSTAASEGKKTISLDTFKQMTAHIPMSSAQVFYLSGGGEPLLCPDLFKIIEYLNTEYPHIAIQIKTNGLLIGAHAEALAKTENCSLDIAVHGTEEVNNSVMEIKETQAIFDGITTLNEILKKRGKKMEKVFRPVVWKYNIENMPALIEKAASVGIDYVKLYFCRFSTTRLEMDPCDSLIHHPKLYYRVISMAEKTAKKNGIKFISTPLMKENFLRMQKECPAPWTVMVIDWDGNVYPCPGWEVLICEKVGKEEYYFGNVLKEAVRDFWHNQWWVEFRRVRISEGKEGKICECSSCPHDPFKEGNTSCRDE